MACEYCDDVLGETADICLGDAWLDRYARDYRGTNIIIVRNNNILKLINKYSNDLYLDDLTTDEVYLTQAGGFRHRRNGLKYRLYLKKINELWYPIKRVNLSNDLPEKRKKIYEKRLETIEKSYEFFVSALRKNDFNIFKDNINILIDEYNKLY